MVGKWKLFCFRLWNPREAVHRNEVRRMTVREGWNSRPAVGRQSPNEKKSNALYKGKKLSAGDCRVDRAAVRTVRVGELKGKACNPGGHFVVEHVSVHYSHSACGTCGYGVYHVVGADAAVQKVPSKIGFASFPSCRDC